MPRRPGRHGLLVSGLAQVDIWVGIDDSLRLHTFSGTVVVQQRTTSQPCDKPEK